MNDTLATLCVVGVIAVVGVALLTGQFWTLLFVLAAVILFLYKD